MDEMNALRQGLMDTCPGMELRENEPMERHTTFRIGGPARLMALPKTREEAAAAVRVARAHGIVPFFLGNGSDLLVSDKGYPGFIIKAVGGLTDLTVEGNKIRAGSGVLLSTLSRAALEHGLTGLEFSNGIPGSLGGAITMNAGAYDGDMSMVVRSVDFVDGEGALKTLSGADLDFAYRHSAFSDGRRLILGAELELAPGKPDQIQALMDDLWNRRRHKQPLDKPSAGSTFKRPQGYFAAALIDECKLKGARVGGAEVSKKHAGFIINAGGATSADVLALARQVQETVLRETGVALELEVRFLGEE
ncbi:UDP-N-acetylmuramate dehydrogenase [uncultured Intestinimonas sp.]|uniref:UDP-N-acetylmuramate dehydrogenase n=1 Tax=uncultured Intestinimonas sp. TaxID=1689265 RepID=UPI0025DABF99|nr:UDP-N-acetylmuramate dehydrogenase [uncultured Intestinimonas sp.]